MKNNNTREYWENSINGTANDKLLCVEVRKSMIKGLLDLAIKNNELEIKEICESALNEL